MKAAIRFVLVLGLWISIIVAWCLFYNITVDFNIVCLSYLDTVSVFTPLDYEIPVRLVSENSFSYAIGYFAGAFSFWFIMLLFIIFGFVLPLSWVVNGIE